MVTLDFDVNFLYKITNMDILSLSFFNNTILEYLIALGFVVGAVFAFKILKFFVIEKLKFAAQRTSNDFDDFIIAAIGKINWPFFTAAGLYIATLFLTLPNVLHKTFLYLFIIVAVYRAVTIIQDAITFALNKAVARKEDSGGTAVAQTLGMVARIAVWVIAIILLLSNFGVDVTSLIAGLGIGGIAIALAAQSIFKDAFSAVSIYLDHPFEIGDFIIFEGNMGTVERIGIKTTRIKTLQGEELIVTNSALTDAKIQNFKKMQKRRILFTVGATYDTSVEKLKKIPQIISAIMNGVDGVDFDRCHFKEFADFSLNFEIVYYVNSSDYNEYMDIQQKVNLSIKEEFEKEGIEMAFPTQTVYLRKET